MLTPPIQVAQDVWQLRVIKPNNWGETFAYLILGKEPALIDPGHPHPVALTSLEGSLRYLGLQLADLAWVIYTHPHTDHMAGGVVLQVTRGLPWKHAFHAGFAPLAEAYPDYARLWGIGHMIYAGIYPELASMLRADEEGNISRIEFPPGAGVSCDLPLLEGQVLNLGRYHLEVVYTPGHNPFHVVLYDRRQEIMFGGDFILDNGPALVDLTGDDIDVYLASLNRVKDLPLKLLLPGHGAIPAKPEEAGRRSGQMIERHRQRIFRCLGRETLTMGAVCDEFFPTANGQARPMAWLRVGVVATCLNWMARHGEVEELIDSDGVKRYRLSASGLKERASG